MSDGDLHYPNLSVCRVTLTGSSATSKPPVSLPSNCLNAASMDLPSTPYDFAMERKVLKRKEEAERDQLLLSSKSREELERATVTKMKNVTGAQEDVCVAMLESNGYDLTTSIETFYLSR